MSESGVKSPRARAEQDDLGRVDHLANGAGDGAGFGVGRPMSGGRGHGQLLVLPVQGADDVFSSVSSHIHRVLNATYASAISRMPTQAIPVSVVSILVPQSQCMPTLQIGRGLYILLCKRLRLRRMRKVAAKLLLPTQEGPFPNLRKDESMSKTIFSTLSALVLLFSGINCSTGIRGGGGGDASPSTPNRADVLETAIGVLRTAGYEINTIDKDKGYVRATKEA